MPKDQTLSALLKAIVKKVPLSVIVRFNPVGLRRWFDQGSQSALQSVSGAVVKGPLENALVFLDYDDDGVPVREPPPEAHLTGLSVVLDAARCWICRSNGCNDC